MNPFSWGLLFLYCIHPSFIIIYIELFYRSDLDVDVSATTSQLSASTSQSSFDADLLYASWLFEEVNPSLISSESEDEETNDNLSSACGTKVGDLTEILGRLASSIKFNISRSNVCEGAVRGISRKSFSPENKISVKFCDDLGTAEGVVDQGRPKRQFFTLVLDSVMNSQIFCGSENTKFLSCMQCVLSDQ